MRAISAYLIVLCTFLTEVAWAQEYPAHLPETSGEKLVLYSDRDIYGSGELIHYSATYKGPDAFQKGSWSSVLYVELISWDGSKQASSKVLIQDNIASGTLMIPESIPSGVFYLRSYTLWMRNFSPASYAYLPLRILNPFSQEMQAGPVEGERNLKDLEAATRKISTEISLSGLEEQYDTRESVELEIQIPEELGSGPYNLVIAKSGDQSSDDFLWKEEIIADSGSGMLEFLPEINGLTLSGRIIDSESSEAVGQAKLQLSSYADPFLYAEVLSAEDGSFLFAFPYYTGNPEFHIAEDFETAEGHRILLASEFCNKTVRLPFIPLHIDSAENYLVEEILINAQLMDRYDMGRPEAGVEETSYPTFYGTGTNITYVRDYIELTDLREFIYEIIPQVSIRNNDKGSFINIQGPNCMDIYPPLVLMDNIPVPNNDELLNIPGQRIERIEVLNQAYIVGNTRYSGIFSIYSSKKDMAGLDQQGERYFFNLQMLDNKGQIMRESGKLAPRLPRISNLLYWGPGISTGENGILKVDFETPDTPGSYILTLRGTDPAINPEVFYRARFSVK